MKSKIVFIAILCCAFVLAISCKDEKAKKPLFTTNANELLFTRQAGEQTFTLRADTTWQISVDKDWLKVSPETGQAGRQVITVSVLSYSTDASDRTATLSIAAGGQKKNIAVMQTATDLAVYPHSFVFDDAVEGEQQTLLVRSNAKWTITSDCPWLSISDQSGETNRQVTLRAPINTDDKERQGIITVSMGDLSQKIEVKQKKSNNILTLIDCDTIELSDMGKYRIYKIAASSAWTAAANDDWASVSPANGSAGITKVKISATENNNSVERNNVITLIMNGKQKTLPLRQGVKGSYWNDGDVLTLYSHTRGKGVPVVLIGDGFDRQDMKKGGWWESKARELVDNYFFVNPIVKDFKDLFDVHVYMAESPEQGVYSENNNRFGCGKPEINFDSAMTLIKQATDIRKVSNIDPGFSTIFIGNGMIGGYAWFEYRMGVYSTDEPPSIYWMSHEFVGHGFTGLADEYGGNGTYMSKDDLHLYQSQGKCLNVADTNDLSKVPWKDFIGREGYEEVGAFQGAFYDDKNAWRPEGHSVMVGWTPEQDVTGPYYNAMSRWMIYREILTQADLPCTFSDFLKFDKQYNVK
jgi:hypothetical protein